MNSIHLKPPRSICSWKIRKKYLSTAIAIQCTRLGKKGWFFSVVGLVNKLEHEKLAGRSCSLTRRLAYMDFVVLDELGYRPFSQAGETLLLDLISTLYESTPLIVTGGFKK